MFGPDFEKNRIFKDSDFEMGRRNSAKLRSVFESLEEVGI